MSHTTARTLQWIAIILIVTAIAGGIYHYFNVRAAKINTSPTALNTNGLVGYWTFDGADTPWTSSSAATTLDKSGQGNTGTLTNMSQSASVTPGKIGQTLNFDGTDDYVSATNVGNVNTISYWIKTNNQANGGIELNANQYIDDNAVPEGMVDATVYVDGAVKTLYGSELVVNGDMEANSTWIANSAFDGWSADTAHRGTYSWKVRTLGGYNGYYQSVSTSYGTQYKASGWMYWGSGVSPFIGIGDPATSYIYVSPPNSNIGVWQYNRGYGTSDQTSSMVYMRSNNGAMTSYFDDVSLKQVLIRYPITDTSSWHHVVITTSTAVSASAVKLGKGGTSYLNGSLDDIRMYNRVLSTAEITNLYSLGAAKQNTSPTALNTNGLVGHWTFDGSKVPWTSSTAATATDSSGSGNTGTLTNMSQSTSVTPGKIGQALAFDKIDDSVTIPPSASLNDLGPTTWSVWIKPRSYGKDSNSTIILGKTNNLSSPANSSWLIIQGSGNCITQSLTDTILWQKDTSTGFNYIGRCGVSGTVQYGVWQNYTVTWDGSHNLSGLHIYKNGTEVAYGDSVASAGSLGSDSALSFRIGNDASGNLTFDGGIDDVRIYNRILSASEIAALYTMGTATVNASTNALNASGLVGQWSFDGKQTVWTSSSAATTLDTSGQSNTGTLTNMSQSTSVTPGKLGQALSFNGGNYVNVVSGTGGPFSTIGTGAFTVSAWATNTDTSLDIYRWIISNFNTTGIHFGIASGCSRCIAAYIGNGASQINSSFNMPSDGSWHHIVITRDGSGNGTFYADGVTKGTFSNSGTIANSGAGAETNIGTRPDHSQFWLGKMDDVRIYNRALSADEISALYNASR